YSEIGNRVRALQQKYDSYLITLENGAQQLLQIYRQANIASRTQASPKQFETVFKLDPELKKAPVFEAPGSIDLKGLNATATSSRKSIEKQHKMLLQVYRTIDQLTAEQARTFDPNALLSNAALSPESGTSQQAS